MHNLDLIIKMKLTHSIYVLRIRHEHKSAFQFLIFSLKALEDDAFLMLFGIRFHICGLLHVTVTHLAALLLSENRHWKSLKL